MSYLNNTPVIRLDINFNIPETLNFLFEKNI